MGNDQSASPSRSAQNSSAVNQSASAGSEPRKSSGIVVVGTADSPEGADLDSYITRLNSCPTFQPIATAAPGSPDAHPQRSDFVSELDWKAAVKASNRLQKHLKDCAEAVSFDQNSLTTEIKRLDQQTNHVLLKYTERQKAFAKHAEHTRKLEEVSENLKKVRRRLDSTFSMLEELNQLLPEEERIEFQ